MKGLWTAAVYVMVCGFALVIGAPDWAAFLGGMVVAMQARAQMS